jgi:hypothetical protein
MMELQHEPTSLKRKVERPKSGRSAPEFSQLEKKQIAWLGMQSNGM